VDIWFTDEVKFQQYGSSCRMWVPPEYKKPILFYHPTRKSVGYFGAVRSRDGKFAFCREEERFNAETFFSFLKYIRRISAHAGRRVVMVADNASYHHARLHKEWREGNLDRFALEFIPPYSPELNPTKRVWKLVRRLATHNRYFSSLEEVMDAVENTFSQWIRGNETLMGLCAIT